MTTPSPSTSTPQTPSPYDTYTSPLASRNASPRMLQLWSSRHKFNTWRRIWLAVAEAQHELGLPVTKEQVEELRAVVERKNPDGTIGITDDEIRLAEKYERDLRHDVMAHVHALGDSCPKAKGIIHLGMTSQDVVCNADLIAIHLGTRTVHLKLVRLIDSLSIQSARHKATPTLAFTHYQPAQPMTIGRRIALWVVELAQCEWRLKTSIESLRLKGLNGATGTQAALLELTRLTGDQTRVEKTRSMLLGYAQSFCGRVFIGTEATRLRDFKTLRSVILKSDFKNARGFRDAETELVASLIGKRGKTQTVHTLIREFQTFLQSCVLTPSRSKMNQRNPVDAVNRQFLSTLHSSFGWHSALIFPRHYSLTGQTYPRVIDTFILADLASTAAVLHKIATDIRLLCNRKEIDEPFETKQIGSSAMPYKRNPMRCERICGLARFVMNLVGNAYDTAATQWLERTLDDSSNRRLSLPEAFLALDGALDLMHNVASGLIVHEAMVRKNLMAELPFMATENILMACVKLGGDRQHYHEVIRVHAQAAGMRVKQEGQDNDLLERLKADKNFWSTARGGPLSAELDWEGVMDPMKYVGRSVEQTERFIKEVVDPMREQYAEELAQLDESGPRV